MGWGGTEEKAKQNDNHRGSAEELHVQDDLFKWDSEKDGRLAACHSGQGKIEIRRGKNLTTEGECN
ncbi:MAG: hypothetical protein ABFD97_21060 [Syntrophobacter sp.]